MPLIKSTSRKAFGHNVAAEMHAGKPLKQSLAIAYSEKRSAAKHNESVGESRVHKKPSNTSSANPKSSASYVEQPMPHSHHSAKRSAAYHNKTVDATYVRPSSTKMTRAEHQLNNMEDFEEKGHKL
jgi:hypothetical protein